MSRVTEMLGIKYPIFLGAMGTISLPDLVVPVSEAGGLGILAASGTKEEVLRNQIREIKSRTDKPFGVNIAFVAGGGDMVIDVCIEEGVPVVTTGAGDPIPYFERLHDAGIKVIPVVPSARVAKKVEKAGADAVIVEGLEAGGHIGEGTTMTLTRMAVEAVDHIPVIAAGGIADGRGLVAAFALGAEAVQIGTLFLTTPEAPIHENYKEIVLSATDTDTVESGREKSSPYRLYKNKAAENHSKLNFDPDVSLAHMEKVTYASLGKATKTGDVENEIVTIGSIAGLITEMKSAGQVVIDVYEEAEDILANLSL